MGSFGIFPLAEAFPGKPRMYARFFRVVLLKEKELLVFDRACVRGFGRQCADSRRATDIWELNLDCIFLFDAALSRFNLKSEANLLSTRSLAHRFQAKALENGDKALESIF